MAEEVGRYDPEAELIEVSVNLFLASTALEEDQKGPYLDYLWNSSSVSLRLISPGSLLILSSLSSSSFRASRYSRWRTSSNPAIGACVAAEVGPGTSRDDAAAIGSTLIDSTLEPAE